MPHFDLVIKNGTVVDGTRVPRYRADLAVKDGRIARIGAVPAAEGERALDASGLIVAPGFVDLHTHYDAQIQWDPYCSISSWHGVTSVVLGNCGFGFAPVRPEERERAMLTMSRTEAIPLESMRAGMIWDWVTFPEWLDTLDRIPKGVNCLSYTPVAPLMIWVMGLEAAKSRPATPAERGEMQRLLREAMEAGACGFSIQRLGENTGQADYDGTPMVTDTMADEDILALAEVLRERGDGFIQISQDTRSKSRDRGFVEKLCEVSGRPVLYNVIIPHFKHPEIFRDQLRWLEQANARGLNLYGQAVTCRGPFTMTLEDWSFFDQGPAWNDALHGSIPDRVRKLRDPDLRGRMIDEIDSGLVQTVVLGGPIAKFVVEDVAGRADLEPCVGRSIGEIAAERGQHPVEALLDIAADTDLAAVFQTSNAFGNHDAGDTGELMQSPYTIPGVSDGGAHTKFLTHGSYPTDFLTWLVRDEGQVTLEEAHFRLSYLPAHAAGFRDRGFLRQGSPADIVVYDLERLRRVPEWVGEVVHDFPAGGWRRIQRAEGYRWILVNGEIASEDGVCTGATPGRLLRHGAG